MTQDIDQFGRDTSNDNTKNLNEEKSKQILDSLAEIKDQLENKEYKPNINKYCMYLNNDKKNFKKNYINAILLKNKKLKIEQIKINNEFKTYLNDYFYKLNK